MSGVQQTSKEAFYAVQGVIPAKERLLLEAYYDHGDMTDKEMAYQVHMPAALVSARRNGLKKRQLVVEKGRRPCRITGMKAIVWGVPKETLF